MNKILFFLLLPFSALSQGTISKTTVVYGPVEIKNTATDAIPDTFRIKAATSTQDGYATKDQVNLLVNTAAKANSTEAATATLTADVKALNDRIARLEALAPGLPVPVEVTTNSYTITPNDNGKTIYVYSNATITLTVQAAGFKCKVIRMGAGRPRFVTSGITLRLRANFTPLSVQYQAVELEWKEGEVVIQ